MEWQEIAGNWILIPRNPIAIVHFLGGAFVAAAPQLTYQWLLEQLAKQGYAIVATPFDSAFGRKTFDHSAIARNSLLRFESALDYLYQRQLVSPDLPIYGVGHSLGCKLHLLNGSLYGVERAGNILMAFNNYPAKRAIPFYEQVSQASSLLDDTVNRTRQWWDGRSPQSASPPVPPTATPTSDPVESPEPLSEPPLASEPKPEPKPTPGPKPGRDRGDRASEPAFSVPGFFNQIAEKVTKAVPSELSEQISQRMEQVVPDLGAEFTPSPEETLQLVAESYRVPCNLLVQFETDDIDQTDDLYAALKERFPEQVVLKQLPGNHLTPIGQDVRWSPSRDFSPVDAVGQFVKQGAYQSLTQLRNTVLDWLG